MAASARRYGTCKLALCHCSDYDYDCWRGGSTVARWSRQNDTVEGTRRLHYHYGILFIHPQLL